MGLRHWACWVAKHPTYLFVEHSLITRQWGWRPETRMMCPPTARTKGPGHGQSRASTNHPALCRSPPPTHPALSRSRAFHTCIARHSCCRTLSILRRGDFWRPRTHNVWGPRGPCRYRPTCRRLSPRPLYRGGPHACRTDAHSAQPQ